MKGKGEMEKGVRGREEEGVEIPDRKPISTKPEVLKLPYNLLMGLKVFCLQAINKKDGPEPAPK